MRARRGSGSLFVPLLVALVVIFAVVPGVAGPGVPPVSEEPAEIVAIDPAEPVAKAPYQDAKAAATEPIETGRWVVEFSARADLTSAPAIRDRGELGAWVVDELRATAASAQERAVELIAAAGGSFDSFWIANVMVVDGPHVLLSELAALPGVASVRPELSYPAPLPVDQGPGDFTVAEPEWGVLRINADQVWDLGITGSGVVVGMLDSGAEYTHPAIVNSYRGNNGDGTFTHDYNWFDATAECPTAEPCDFNGHGTHTTGTVAGGDGLGPFAPDIGVAPDAKWMMASCGAGFCSESQLLAAGEWFLAPTDVNGDNPDPAMRPHVVNNSWGLGPGVLLFEDIVSAWRASGIVPVFAAGNSGPECATADSPGDYPGSFSAGAIDIEGNIAFFSSRGPSVFDGIKPNVSAPGVDVLSSVPGEGYAEFSGTSMAAPHVVGTVALMLSAAPDLAGDVAAIEQIISQTAVDTFDDGCGAAPGGDPNNVFGDGVVDALAATVLVATGGTLQGTVTDSVTAGPIAGAEVVAFNEDRAVRSFTGADGSFSAFLPEGVYDVMVSAFAYEDGFAGSIEIVADTVTTQDFALVPLPRFALTGTVLTAGTGDPVSGATVRVLGTPLPPFATGADGAFAFSVPAGVWTLQAGAGGCSDTALVDVDVVGDTDVAILLLPKIDDFGHGCTPIAFDWVPAAAPAALFGDDIVGRLALPFPFPFYGETYETVFVDSNGYLTFGDVFDPFMSEFFNTPIPSRNFPNAAIYAHWADLWIDPGAAIYTDRIEAGGLQGFVVEWRNIRLLFGSEPFSFQVRLWEDGAVDLLFGENMANSRNGANATIGLENAAGDDAFQFSFRSAAAEPGTAWRFDQVPAGFASGIVTNANDGLPVDGATITALPGGRDATTDEGGMYHVLLLPGDYMLTASADGYAPASADVSIVVGETTIADFALEAPAATVTPESIDATALPGTTVVETLTISNGGTLPLEWELRERSGEFFPPVLPPLEIEGEPLRRLPGWDKPAVPDLSSYTSAVTRVEDLEVVIEDAIGDGGPVDIVTVLGGLDENEFAVQIDFADDVFELGGLVFFDTDQNVDTGLPPQALDGLPSQDLGIDYFADIFLVLEEGIVLIVDTEIFDVVAVVPAEFDGRSLRFDVPLDAVGHGEAIDIGMVVGDFFGPTDWAPEAGKGTIEPGGGADIPWLTPEPISGLLGPGESIDVAVTLGGPDAGPGDYVAELVLRSNDPRGRKVIPVHLNVPVPDGFGSMTGTVSDAFFGHPISGAEVAVLAEVDGEPFVNVAVTGGDGFYTMLVPDGTWPVDVTADGYLPFGGEVTVATGFDTRLDATLEPKLPVPVVDPTEIRFGALQKHSVSATVVLANEGLGDLEYSIREVEVVIDEIDTGFVGLGDSRLRGDAVPVGAVHNDGSVLVLMDDLPWGSEALFILLDLNGVPFDVAGSDDMGSIDVDSYKAVIVANDQPQRFYDAYADNLVRLEDYVRGGGLLWVGAASAGFNGGLFGGAPLPGDVAIFEEEYEEINFVVEPDHPAVAGVPPEVFGTLASHSGFAAPDDALVVMVAEFSGLPTLIEYRLGSGTVFATGQPLEFNWEEGQDGGPILENMVAIVAEGSSFVDIPWLFVAPEGGIVPPGGSTPVTVTADGRAGRLRIGIYHAAIAIDTNDPFTPVITVPITLEVVGLRSLLG